MSQPENPESPSGAPPAPAEETKPIAAALRQMRQARNESQRRFWARFGVTQSRGSRFELGKAIPSPVAILLRLYIDGVISDGDLWRARRGKRLAQLAFRAAAAPDARPSPPRRGASSHRA